MEIFLANRQRLDDEGYNVRNIVSVIADPALNPDCGLDPSVVGILAGVRDVYKPEDSDEELSKIPGYFESRGKMMPTLSELAAAYRYDFPEDVAAAHMVYWTALYANVESACARQRRRKARLPLLLCRHRYYAVAEEGAGERAPADVVVALARPGLEGAFRHMVTFL